MTPKYSNFWCLLWGDYQFEEVLWYGPTSVRDFQTRVWTGTHVYYKMYRHFSFLAGELQCCLKGELSRQVVVIGACILVYTTRGAQLLTACPLPCQGMGWAINDQMAVAEKQPLLKTAFYCLRGCRGKQNSLLTAMTPGSTAATAGPSILARALIAVAEIQVLVPTVSLLLPAHWQ